MKGYGYMKYLKIIVFISEFYNLKESLFIVIWDMKEPLSYP